MQRRSYYPQNNPQIVSTVTATSSTGVISRPVTPATIPGDAGDIGNGGIKEEYEGNLAKTIFEEIVREPRIRVQNVMDARGARIEKGS